MSDDALQRLRSRKRPKVRQRDASLSSGHVAPQSSEDINPSAIEVETSTVQKSEDIQTSRPIESSASDTQTPKSTDIQTSTIKDISTSRHLKVQTFLIPQPSPVPPSQSIPSPEEELQVKRSTFRMEEALTERLHSLCREKKISREVMMEAMFEYMEAHPEAMDQVLAVAEEKNAYRQQIANRKRAEAMMQKFGNP